MSTIDVVQLVKDGKAKFEWADVLSTHEDKELTISVFRDAMKFDDIPALTWDFKPIPGNDQIYNGVRLPASADQLQQIADVLGCMLLTPKVVDLIWLQAQLKFNPVINDGPPRYNIVAISNINDVHDLIQKKIEGAGGDDGYKLIACVGKYWVLCNALGQMVVVHGDLQAFNYGWPDANAPTSRRGVTSGVKVWQNLAGAHNKLHWDPSQTIRLMFQWAWLKVGDADPVQIHLHDVASDPELAPLLHHEGELKVFRQSGVPEPKGEVQEDGTILMPEIIIYGAPPKHPMVPVREGGHRVKVIS